MSARPGYPKTGSNAEDGSGAKETAVAGSQRLDNTLPS